MSNELPRAVLDASILIQALVREKYTELALKLIGMLKAIYVPSLILYEVGNALVILTRKRFITKEDAIRKFEFFSSIPTIDIREITLSRAIEIAVELKVTLYNFIEQEIALSSYLPSESVSSTCHITLIRDNKSTYDSPDFLLYTKSRQK